MTGIRCQAGPNAPLSNRFSVLRSIVGSRPSSEFCMMEATDGRFMTYIISARDSAGGVSIKRDTAAAAIKKAVELMGEGSWDVQITDPDGRVYGHAEFTQLYAARA